MTCPKLLWLGGDVDLGDRRRGRRRSSTAAPASEELLHAPIRPRRDELLRLAGLLANHVAALAAVRRREGVRSREAASRLKMHPFVAQKAFAQAANFSVAELQQATIETAALDHALKGGSRLSGDLELQRTLVAITRPEEARSETR